VIDSKYEEPVLQLLETIGGRTRWSVVRADALRPVAERLAHYAPHLAGLDAYVARLRRERRQWHGA
jgi:hypothetical protein